MKFRLEIEVDGAEVSRVIDELGQGVLRTALENPQVLGVITQVAASLGMTTGVTLGRAVSESRNVTPIRRSPPPWATPEARAAAEAAGPPPLGRSPGQGWSGPEGQSGPPTPPVPPAPSAAGAQGGDGAEKWVSEVLKAPLT